MGASSSGGIVLPSENENKIANNWEQSQTIEKSVDFEGNQIFRSYNRFWTILIAIVYGSKTAVGSKNLGFPIIKFHICVNNSSNLL